VHKIAMPVVAGNEHRPAMAFASWLSIGDQWRLVPCRSHISETLTKTAATKAIGAAEELDGIICAEGSDGGLHYSKMFVAQRQQIGSHSLCESSIDQDYRMGF
jgi:hypothetical protein